jgi:hypothetical protein
MPNSTDPTKTELGNIEIDIGHASQKDAKRHKKPEFIVPRITPTKRKRGEDLLDFSATPDSSTPPGSPDNSRVDLDWLVRVTGDPSLSLGRDNSPTPTKLRQAEVGVRELRIGTPKRPRNAPGTYDSHNRTPGPK